MPQSKSATSTRKLRQVAYAAYKNKRRVVITYGAKQVVGGDHETVIRAAVAQEIAKVLEKDLGISPTVAATVGEAWPDLTKSRVDCPSPKSKGGRARTKLVVTVEILGLAPGALKRIFPEARARSA